MIRVDSLPAPYQSEISSGTHVLVSDAPVAKGGGGEGFGAHQLLEASLAACINMAIRMHATQLHIPLEHVVTKVGVSWPDAGVTRFEYAIELTGPLTDGQRAELERVAESCPVRKTLTNALVFEKAGSIGG